MTGKTIFVAGGNSGIGLETVKLLLGQGAQVICAGRQADELAALNGVQTLAFDATSGEVPDWQLPEVVDGFLYCPGTINLKPFHGLKDADFEHDFAVNVLGAVRAFRAVLPSLKKSPSASAVFFSTVAVQTGLKFHASVAAAKGAVEGLTRSLAAEFAPTIRVNCIAPGLHETPLAASFLNSAQKQEAARERNPLRQVGDPADTAALVSFLLGEQSRFMTGQVLTIDGGLSALRPL